jgi:hypothetical protein
VSVGHHQIIFLSLGIGRPDHCFVYFFTGQLLPQSLGSPKRHITYGDITPRFDGDYRIADHKHSAIFSDNVIFIQETLVL